VLFGASDGPMMNEQILAAGFRILHLPTVLGGVVPVYNIPGVSAELRFPGKLLADIFIGKVTKWNNAEIRRANPGVNLPGVGGKGNEGVSGLVKQTPGAIGYVELIYALQNLAGEFVKPTLETVTRAAAGAAAAMPKDFRVSIANPPGHDVYPISSFTWLLVQVNPKDKVRARILSDFIRWALTDGQRYCAELGYAPLPKEVVALEMEALKKVHI
jgi:phosphate transport system substrate-binding protein